MENTKERYFLDEEDTFYTLDDLAVEWHYRSEAEKEDYENDFWLWLSACQDYNGGTLKEIYKHEEYRK